MSGPVNDDPTIEPGAAPDGHPPGPGGAWLWSSPTAKRLLVALGLCIALAVACWVLAPRLGVYMPPVVPLLGFGVIAAGTVLGLWEAEKARNVERTEDGQPPDLHV